MRHQRLLFHAAIVASALGLVVAAPGGAATKTTKKPTTTKPAVVTTVPAGVPATTAAAGGPKKGGTLTISPGSLSILGLDPTIGITTGCCGGTELMSIYDTLVRYNPTTDKYDMRTAESLEPNADYTEWTLKLKPNLKFTDGTDYNADAVKFNVDRTAAQPRSQEFPVLNAFLESATVVDPLTVKFKLKQGWVNFPVTLAAGTGMIASPTAIQKQGANFNTIPSDAGAGAFKVQSFKPNESLVLVRNPNYYGGDVYLDSIRSVYVAGGDAQYQALKTGAIGGFMQMEAAPAATAVADKTPGLNFPYYAGNLILMNGGQVLCRGGAPANLCKGAADGTVVENGAATKDPTVRRAVLAAVDPTIINQRVYNNSLNVYRTLVPRGAKYDPGLPGPTYDPSLAKALVARAKADGWDGKIRMTFTAASQLATNYMQAMQAMLNAVGMNAVIDNPTSLAQLQTEGNFDIVPSFGFGTSEDRFFEGLYSSLRNYRYGYSSPDMDAALDLMRTASTDAQKKAAYTAVAQVLYRDAPIGIIGDAVRTFFYSPKLHGVQPNAFQIVDLSKAWLDQ